MLIELRVENLGIIAELTIVLGDGLTAITGETGAGKTLLVDALELLCGGRADPQAVRDGAAEARVEARFVTELDEVVLARVVPCVGRSRGYINGRLATAFELAEIGRELVDLHGQHVHQSLLAAAEQRALLDRYTGSPASSALTKLRAACGRMHDIDDELERLGGDDRSRAREADLLRYQLDEIAAAALADSDEDVRLADEEQLLGDAEAHREALHAAHAALEGSAEDAIGQAVASLAGREVFDGLSTRVRALQAEVAEAAHDLRAASEAIVADPDRLADVHARRALLREITRKYGPTITEVAAYASEARARLDDLERHDERFAALATERSEADASAQRAAGALTKARRKASVPFADEVTTRPAGARDAGRDVHGLGRGRRLHR